MAQTLEAAHQVLAQVGIVKSTKNQEALLARHCLAL